MLPLRLPRMSLMSTRNSCSTLLNASAWRASCGLPVRHAAAPGSGYDLDVLDGGWPDHAWSLTSRLFPQQSATPLISPL